MNSIVFALVLTGLCQALAEGCNYFFSCVVNVSTFNSADHLYRYYQYRCVVKRIYKFNYVNVLDFLSILPIHLLNVHSS